MRADVQSLKRASTRFASCASTLSVIRANVRKHRRRNPCVFSCYLANQIDINHASQKGKMTVIVLASQKGGAGKTTLAVHLAVTAEAAGDGPAILIDTGLQGSLSSWWNERQAEDPKLAPVTIAELPEKLELLGLAGYRVVIIDTPPAITEAIEAVVRSADLVLIPTRPSPHDLRAVGSTVALVQGAGKPFVFAVYPSQAEYAAHRAGHGGAVPARHRGPGDHS
jgi:Mrp family chromosome partitioning ATPase